MLPFIKICLLALFAFLPVASVGASDVMDMNTADPCFSVALPSLQDIIQNDAIIICQQELEKLCQWQIGPYEHLARIAHFFDKTAFADIRKKQVYRALQHMRLRRDEIDRLLNDVYVFMDQYEDADWEERFLNSGLYPRVVQLRKFSRLLAVAHIHAEMIIPDPVGPPLNSEQIEKIESALQELRSLETDISDKALGWIRYWRLRFLMLELHQKPQVAPEIVRLFEILEQESLSEAQILGVRLEHLRFLYVQGISESEWSGLVTDLQLELCLQDSDLSLMGVLWLTVWQSSHVHPYYQPAQKVETICPALKTVVRRLVAQRCLCDMQKLSVPAWVQAYDPWAVQILAEYMYMQNTDANRQMQLVSLMEIFLNQDLSSSQRMPLFYWLGLYHRRLHNLQPDSHGSHLAQALEYWQAWCCGHLAHAKTIPQDVDPADIASHLGPMSFELYKVQPDLYLQPAINALTLLVGTFPPGEEAPPQGPWAQIPAAREMRYVRGLLSVHQENYSEALRWFSSVPPDDQYADLAAFQIVRCQRRLLQKKKRDPNQAELIEWITRLKTILPPDQELTSVSEKALSWQIDAGLLLAQCYLECSPPQPLQTLQLVSNLSQLDIEPSQQDRLQGLRLWAWQLTGQRKKIWTWLADLSPRQWGPYTANLALSSMHDELKDWMSWHAEHDFSVLSEQLSLLVPIIKRLHITLADTNPFLVHKSDPATVADHDRQDLLSHRNAALVMLESLAWLAFFDQEGLVTLNPDTDLSESAAVIVQNLYHTRNETLSLLRSQALLSMAHGDYTAARRQWARLRSSLTNPHDEHERFLWSQARWFGLYCLKKQHNTDELCHAVEVLLHSNERLDSQWLQRVQSLCPTTSLSSP